MANQKIKLHAFRGKEVWDGVAPIKGDRVKIGVMLTPEAVREGLEMYANCAKEWIWVEVLSIEDDTYHAVVRSGPINKNISWNDPVDFKRKHIWGILPALPKKRATTSDVERV